MEVNEYPDNTKDSLKADIVRVMSEHLIRAYNWFRPRIKAVIDASGGFIE